jgi:PDDEXK-like uncharacterized protein DUF3799
MEKENTAPAPEIINGIDYDRIRKKILSYSSLKQFNKSPEHFVHYLNSGFKPTPAMIFGSLLDKMILTPGTWEEEFTVFPEKPPLKKDLVELHGKEIGAEMYAANKIKHEEWLTANTGKTFVTQEQIETAKFITAKVFANHEAAALLSLVTQTQKRVEFTDKATGLKVCGYEDGEGDTIIMDLKSCVSAEPEKFGRQAVDLGYDLQAAVYLEAAKLTSFKFPEYWFLCVETSEPYGISVIRASDEFIEYGKLNLRTALDNFKYCLDNKLFHQSYQFKNKFGPLTLELPSWLKRKIE